MSYDQEAKRIFEGQKWVKRLIYVPEVVWDDQIAKLLQALALKVPRKDHDVYTSVDIPEFIQGATPGFRTALVGNLLDAIGVELSFTEEEGKFIPSVAINPKKRSTAEETIKSIVRKRDSDNKTRNFVNERTRNAGIPIDRSSYDIKD